MSDMGSRPRLYAPPTLRVTLDTASLATSRGGAVSSYATIFYILIAL